VETPAPITLWVLRQLLRPANRVRLPSATREAQPGTGASKCRVSAQEQWQQSRVGSVFQNVIEDTQLVRECANRCRRLAREAEDERTRCVLLDMAYEYDARMKLAQQVQSSERSRR
jgi:hypothetical protein